MSRRPGGARSALAIFRENPIRVILCAETRKIPAGLQAFGERHRMIAAASRFDPHLLQSRLTGLVRERLERTVVYQGGLIEIGGRGLLLTGDSGCGKTTCALCLAKRGARWIADDRVEIVGRRRRLLGRAPRSIRGLVALKTLGVADVTQFVDPQTVKESADIAGVVGACGDARVKVIIEAALLDDEETAGACRLVRDAGARFVKTSTGFGPPGASVRAVEIMRRAVGPGFGVKASAGIRTAAFALELVRAGADRIGTSAGVAIMEEWKKLS
jgi:hypothetical protein